MTRASVLLLQCFSMAGCFGASGDPAPADATVPDIATGKLDLGMVAKSCIVRNNQILRFQLNGKFRGRLVDGGFDDTGPPGVVALSPGDFELLVFDAAFAASGDYNISTTFAPGTTGWQLDLYDTVLPLRVTQEEIAAEHIVTLEFSLRMRVDPEAVASSALYVQLWNSNRSECQQVTAVLDKCILDPSTSSFRCGG